MASFVCVADLPVPPDDAWAFVVDHGWTIEPLRFEPQGDQGVGTLNRLSGRIACVPIRGVSRTVEWTRPKRCVFGSVKPAWPVTTCIVETFAPVPTGTRRSISYEVTPRGLVGAVAAPI